MKRAPPFPLEIFDGGAFWGGWLLTPLELPELHLERAGHTPTECYLERKQHPRLRSAAKRPLDPPQELGQRTRRERPLRGCLYYGHAVADSLHWRKAKVAARSERLEWTRMLHGLGYLHTRDILLGSEGREGERGVAHCESPHLEPLYP